jgi:hypothetical protein
MMKRMEEEEKKQETSSVPPQAEQHSQRQPLDNLFSSLLTNFLSPDHVHNLGVQPQVTYFPP